METSYGVIYGYDEVTEVDNAYQIIVYVESFGKVCEHDLLEPPSI